MRFIRSASFEEFVTFYLSRERRKGRLDPQLTGLSWDTLAAEMRRSHRGKLRPWFEHGRWSVVSLDGIEDAMSLVCLKDEAMKAAGLIDDSKPDGRLMRAVVAAAHKNSVFDNNLPRSACIEGFRVKRIEAYRRSWPELRGDDMLVLCTLNAAEKSESPGGSWYLHDGLGRLVPHLYATVYEGREYRPIEALLAEES